MNTTKPRRPTKRALLALATFASSVGAVTALLAGGAAPAGALPPLESEGDVTITRVVTCQRMVGSICDQTLVCYVQSNGYWWCENGQSGGR
jgi:hypothetical protein